MRRRLIAGNWKMFLDLRGAIQLATGLKRELADVEDVDLAVFPPFPFLPDVAEVLRETGIAVGGQNLSHKPQGALTGEVAGPMLVSVGCTRALVGHSERRDGFAETDDVCNAKLRAALDAGLLPILCVGEHLPERKAGQHEAVVTAQVRGSLKSFTPEEVERMTIAYEPVWAIGTGETATPEQANAMHGCIRRLVGELFGSVLASSTRILYGGSVKPENASSLLDEPEIDGALVGGASLEVEKFVAIVKA